jgi:dihydrofolate reductase
MTKIVADITMSLDGFVTGPNPDLAHGLGIGGEPLHAWVTGSDNEVDAEVLREAVEATGAVVLGRRLFDVVDGPNGWSEDMGYGAGHATKPPMFVVTHQPPDSVRLASQFSFVTDGLEAAIGKARAAAREKNVVVMGGGHVVRQSIESRLIDELQLHLAPIVLGSGTPLFDGGRPTQFIQESVRVSPFATHLTYRLDTQPR